MKRTRGYSAADFVRQLVFAWLFAALLEYLLLPATLRDLSGLKGLAQMRLGRVIAVTAIVTALLWVISRYSKMERWGITAAFGLLAVAALSA